MLYCALNMPLLINCVTLFVSTALALGLPTDNALNSLTMELQSYIEDLQFMNPSLNSDCAGKVLSDFIPECSMLSFESTDTLKVEFAVKLSVCEFEAAGVFYPTDCKEITAVECAQLLQAKPQWWTTYSNNYHSIGDICLQHRQSFPVGEILSTYEQIFRYHQALAEKFQTALRAVQERELYFNSTLERQNSQFQVLEQRLSGLGSTIAKNNDILAFASEELFRFVGVVQEAVGSMTVQLDQVGHSQEDLLDNFSAALASTLESSLTTVREAESAVESDTSRITQALQRSLNQTIKGLLPALKMARIQSELVYKTSKSSSVVLEQAVTNSYYQNDRWWTWSAVLKTMVRYILYCAGAILGSFYRRLFVMSLGFFYVTGFWQYGFALSLALASFLFNRISVRRETPHHQSLNYIEYPVTTREKRKCGKYLY